MSYKSTPTSLPYIQLFAGSSGEHFRFGGKMILKGHMNTQFFCTRTALVEPYKTTPRSSRYAEPSRSRHAERQVRWREILSPKSTHFGGTGAAPPPFGISTPNSNTMCPGLIRVPVQNCSSIVSAVFAQLTDVTDRQTHKQATLRVTAIGIAGISCFDAS